MEEEKWGKSAAMLLSSAAMLLSSAAMLEIVVDVKCLLESFAAHPEIGNTSKSMPQWNKEEQSTALATATSSTMRELAEWNVRYKEKFGFVFLICASGRGTPEILAELKVICIFHLFVDVLIYIIGWVEWNF
ncbi:uncharacterized protein A4U43_C07F32280 [Asparagus officinalis]|uniref:2-oxo-4-hydroxy-4-carboxy-5-ureidoimidazoline decarboxylase n=1 Tax=Asparagus officinalis TaxID=4686 RepID=A0A5P1EIG6_ASPOF|nr:uncharacterized protein A4U43_C07F32280 [Asparagus officinalis]